MRILLYHSTGKVTVLEPDGYPVQIRVPREGWASLEIEEALRKMEFQRDEIVKIEILL